MSLLAETAELIDDVDSAALIYELLAPWAGLNAGDHPEGIRGSVSRYLGMLAAMLDRPADAARHFDDAITMNTKMGARVWVAHTQYDYASLLLERGEPGDGERAQELLASARALSEELGLQVLAERASAGVG